VVSDRSETIALVPGRNWGYVADMFLPIVVISAAMAAPPPTHIDHVIVEQSADSAQVLGYDADGEVAIELSIWLAEDEPRIAATLPSGGYLLIGAEGIIDSHDHDSVKAQFVELSEALDITAEVEQATWLECGLAAAGAIGGCVGVRPLACVGGSILAACECLPLTIDEFEGMHCPLLD
jgi:hypothetical protein